MENYPFVKWLLLSVTLILMACRFLYAKNFKKRHKKFIYVKWMGWYNASEMNETSSPSRRFFMQLNNILHILIIGCTLLTILLFLLPLLAFETESS
jgi:hypothetical protein